MNTFIRTKKTTPSGILTVAGTVLAQNTARISYKINNLGTNPLFVKEGSGASSTNFDYILAGGTSADDGTGASYDSPSGECHLGVISVAGTSPRFSGSERTEEDNSN